MKIIVVGDGKVGLTLTEQLSKEEHDLVVIDKNPTVLPAVRSCSKLARRMQIWLSLLLLPMKSTCYAV